MSIAALKTYSNNKFYLTANADNRDITISAADAVVLQNWVQHFGTRKCRLLLSTFAKQDQQNYNQTTFVVSGINTSTGVITPCENIPSHTNYTTTGYSYVGINLMPDGDNAQYSSGWLSTTGLTDFKDTQKTAGGLQSLYCQATTASGEGYINLTVSGLESYNVSFWHQTGLSGQQCRVKFIDQTNATVSGYNETILNTGVLDAQKWTYYNAGIEIPSTCTTLRVKVVGINSNDRVWIDRFNVTQTLNSDPGFEDPTVSTDWTSSGTPTATGVDINVRTGSQALEISSSDSGNYKYRDFLTISGNYYRVKTHIKTSGAGTGTCVLSNAASKTLTTISGIYQELSHVFKAVTPTLRIAYYNSGGNLYTDDLVVEPLEVVTPSTETPSIEANSYQTGRWGTADYAYRVDGSDTLIWTTAGRVGASTGSFGINVLMMPYNSYPQDAYLWGVEDALRLYYDSTNYQFKFDIYDGAAWQTARGPTMTNTVSGWKHVCATWDNTDGCDIYVNTASGYRHGESWSAQALPVDMYICSHWAGNKQWDTLFDDIVIYQNTLSAANVTSLFDA